VLQSMHQELLQRPQVWPVLTSTSPWPTRSATGVRESGSTPNRKFIVVFRRQMHDPNLDQLIAAADALRPLLPELVFVGGCVTGLLITDEAAGEPRGTIDVDAIAEITSYTQYTEFGDRMRRLGFSEDTSEGAPVCRWVQGGMILDVMPLDERILGFSNRWYKAAMEASVTKNSATILRFGSSRLRISSRRSWKRSRSADAKIFSEATASKTSFRSLTDAKL